MSSTLRDSMPPGVGEIPRIRTLWGTFVDPALEREFAKEDFAVAVQKFVRFSVTVSLLAFLGYGVHDALVIPEIRSAAWTIRFLAFGPVAALLVLFVFKNKRHDLHQPAMLVFGLAVNTVVIWIGAISPPAGFFLYTAYAIVFVTVGPFLARMSMKTQLVYTALTLVLYNAFDAALAHAAPMVHLSINVATLTLGCVGAVAARQLDLQGRLAFLQRRIIREQMAALDAERTRSETLLLNVLPRRIAGRLKEKPGVVIADRFASATVLFSDIVGFTQMSTRLTPEELVKRLDEIFSRFDGLAEQLGLEKIKTIGDAYMVCGGIPNARADHAEAVCEMALRMRDSVADLATELGFDLRVRIGVHTGPVVAGVIGKKKFIYDVWGDTVNTASRMESHGVPNAIQVSDATYELTKTVFDFEPRGTIDVKGKGEMKTYLLLQHRPLPSERQASLPSQRTPKKADA
ncbi:MAG: adenylate/guanylate cyclase [Labilithrix sp.]|nr:adenylate/guanylate cyclase [Labilithrix sp.]